MRALVFALVFCAALPALAARKLVDEVVAVVDAHSITLSELQAETRIRLVEAQGAAVAFLPLDRKLLAASLRKTIEERVVIAEVERLKLFDLDRAEVEALVARVRVKFAKETDWEAFTRFIELTDDEIGNIVARELRVARYLDNRLKLAAQVRDSELAALEGNRKLNTGEKELLREKLAQEKYQRLLQDLLADLRKRATVRVLDPLDPEPTSASGGQPGKGG
ncbi:MAG TPA: hypothetical protein VH083_01625 [Myxococcales bacterium]|nr:hypothetical protein [Myxococcales bacterium]